MSTRQRQDQYSQIQPLMADEDHRTRKAAKIAAIIEHFRDLDDLSGLTVLDVGCSTGIIARCLAARGADVIGSDIDVPGVTAASNHEGDATYLLTDSEQMAIRDDSVDIVVCNHIYEHVVAPDRLMAELRRVVRPTGVLYLGLGNRLGVMEPHHRLPFLSWLPPALADRYMRVAGRGDTYHERFRTRAGLRKLCAGLHVWDYSLTILRSPKRFAAEDVAPSWIRSVPSAVLRSAEFLVPTYLWVATVSPSTPAGPDLPEPPRSVAT